MSAPRFDLDCLENLCSGYQEGVHEIVQVDGQELLDLIAEFRRMTPVVVAAMAWRSDRTTGGWLVGAIDEYRKQRRAAGLDPAKETP